MNRQHYLDSVETVLAWNLSEEAFANAITQQLFGHKEFENEDAWNYCLEQSEIFH